MASSTPRPNTSSITSSKPCSNLTTSVDRSICRKRNRQVAGLLVEPAKDVATQRQKLMPRVASGTIQQKMELVSFHKNHEMVRFTAFDEDLAESKVAEEKGDDDLWIDKTEEEFQLWLADKFGSFPRVVERKFRPYEDGDEFNCLQSTDPSLSVCFVRHARIHKSPLGWIESCSVGRLDDEGFLESWTFGGYDRVAIKAFEVRKTFGTPLQENACGELRMHARLTVLNHKGICPLLGCFRTNEVVFAVYPMFVGGDAFEYLSTLDAKNERIDEPQLKQFLRGAVQSLAACHEVGVAHRDISLENFVLKDDNLKEPVLIDFGVSANMIDEKGSVVHTGPVGKAKYMAPEMCTDPKCLRTYDGRKADVFSLGVVLLILCTRVEPWDSTSASDIRFNRMILKGDLAMVLQLWGVELSKPFLHLMTRMLNPYPEDRPSVTEILQSDWLNNNI